MTALKLHRKFVLKVLLLVPLLDLHDMNRVVKELEKKVIGAASYTFSSFDAVTEKIVPHSILKAFLRG